LPHQLINSSTFGSSWIMLQWLFYSSMINFDVCCMSWFMWRTWHIPIIHHYEKLCPPKPHYLTTRAKKNSYTTIVKLSSFQALQIIFDMQSQGISQKNLYGKHVHTSCKMFFFSFFSFWPLILSNLITYLFLIHFERFKVL
jgi:hypothetical protein